MKKISKNKQLYLFNRCFTLLPENNSYKRNDIEVDIESIKDMQFERFKEYIFYKLKDTPEKRINLSPTERNGLPSDKKRYNKSLLTNKYGC